MKIGRYVVGLISGLTFGLLFAPKKGSALRKEIASKHKKDDGLESLKVLGGAFKEAGTEIFREFKQLAQHEQVEAALEMSKDKIRTYLDSLDEDNRDVLISAKAKLEELADMAMQKAAKFQASLEKKKGGSNAKPSRPSKKA